MARPKAFDRDAALRAGVEVFWRQGFAATTTDDLARAMGIGRQSFYDTFGDKRRCYLEALRSYTREQLDGQEAAMRAAAPLDALRALLRAPADGSAARRRLGCLVVNALAEHGARERDVRATLHPSAERIEAAVRALLLQARARGELAPSVDVPRAARTLLVVRAGLMVHAKAGWSADDLRQVADLAVDQLLAARG